MECGQVLSKRSAVKHTATCMHISADTTRDWALMHDARVMANKNKNKSKKAVQHIFEAEYAARAAAGTPPDAAGPAPAPSEQPPPVPPAARCTNCDTPCVMCMHY